MEFIKLKLNTYDHSEVMHMKLIGLSSGIVEVIPFDHCLNFNDFFCPQT